LSACKAFSQLTCQLPRCGHVDESWMGPTSDLHQCLGNESLYHWTERTKPCCRERFQLPPSRWKPCGWGRLPCPIRCRVASCIPVRCHPVVQAEERAVPASLSNRSASSSHLPRRVTSRPCGRVLRTVARRIHPPQPSCAALAPFLPSAEAVYDARGRNYSQGITKVAINLSHTGSSLAHDGLGG